MRVLLSFLFLACASEVGFHLTQEVNKNKLRVFIILLVLQVLLLATAAAAAH